MDMAPNRSILPLYATDATLFTVLPLIVIAAVHVALAVRNVLPQLTELNGLEDVSTHLVAIKEVGSMNVVAPAIIPITLLHRVDVTDEVVEERITSMLGNEPI